MGQQFDNTNRGALFDNNRKERDSQPDMTGKIDINGTEHFISGWWKDGKNGRYLSLAKQNRENKPGGQGGQGQQRPAQQRPATGGRGGPLDSIGGQSQFQDEDIPF